MLLLGPSAPTIKQNLPVWDFYWTLGTPLRVEHVAWSQQTTPTGPAWSSRRAFTTLLPAIAFVLTTRGGWDCSGQRPRKGFARLARDDGIRDALVNAGTVCMPDAFFLGEQR